MTEIFILFLTVVNIGEWYGTVEMDVNTGLLRRVVSIMDPNRGNKTRDGGLKEVGRGMRRIL